MAATRVWLNLKGKGKRQRFGGCQRVERALRDWLTRLMAMVLDGVWRQTFVESAKGVRTGSDFGLLSLAFRKSKLLSELFSYHLRLLGCRVKTEPFGGNRKTPHFALVFHFHFPISGASWM